MRSVNSFREEQTDRSKAINIPYRISELAIDESLEPQVVKVRSQNRDSLIVNANYDLGVNRITIPGYLINRAKRIALHKIRADFCIPTLHGQFNRIEISVNGLAYSVLLPATTATQCYLSTPLALAQAIAAAINIDVPGFTMTVAATGNNIITWTGNQVWCFFNGNSSNMLRDPAVLGFKSYTFAEANARLKAVWTSQVEGLPIRYVDIGSRALTMDSKISKSGNLDPNFLTRIHLNSMLPHVREYFINEPTVWINVDERHIDVVDLNMFPNLLLRVGDIASFGGEPILPFSIKLSLEFLVES